MLTGERPFKGEDVSDTLGVRADATTGLDGVAGGHAVRRFGACSAGASRKIAHDGSPIWPMPDWTSMTR